jgi:phosphoglycerol transferase MdoB-like AlkP superfamily enzyme
MEVEAVCMSVVPRPRMLALSRLGRYAIVVEALALVVALFTLLRVLLFACFVGRHGVSAGQAAHVFFVGFRFDLLVGLLLLLPLSLHMAVYGNRRVLGRLSRLGIHAALLVMLLIVVFVCCAEFLFFDEFKSRLNYIAFEYLAYPTEVFGNIWQSYPVVPLLGGVAAAAVGIYLLLRRRIMPRLQVELSGRRRFALLGCNLAAIAGLWFTTGMGRMEVCENRVANECSGNGLYTVAYYGWTSRFDYEAFYLTTDSSDAYRRVQARIAAPGDRFEPASTNPLDRTVASASPRRDLNVVVILEESFGANFIGALGDQRNLTPHFDGLCREGILLDNFYATGNRTARALEAILASLPPIPTESILKRDHSEHVYTLARLLADRGYQREFIYGGRGLFDGMRSFMVANGFERFIEQHDYAHPTFVAAWGVCDEDIFHSALDEFDAMHARGKPFFGMVLTVSNHQPFTYPDGRIDLPAKEQKQFNAVKYADWAIGDFFSRARSHAFFSNTVFVILGDHGARVYGSQMFPVRSYRIPVLMLLPGGERAGTRCSTLGSSLDIAPTIMGVLGGPYRSVFYGRDVLHIDPASAYALMQHNHDVALLGADEQLVMLGCPKTVSAYRLNGSDFLNQLTRGEPADPAGPRVRDVISFYQTADELYYADRLFPSETRAPESLPSR